MGRPDTISEEDNETTGLQTKKEIFKDKGKDWPQIIAVLIACMSCITSGLFMSWPSPFIVKITQDKEHYDISENQASYFTVWINVGITVFSPFFAIVRLPDIIGRKPTMLLTPIPQIISWLMKAFSTDLYVLYVARFIAGLADAFLFASLPAYIGEVTTPKIRGTWGNSLVCSIFLGQFLMNIIGVYSNVQQASFICLTLPLLFSVLLFFMPESPYFYIMKGRDTDAKVALQWLRGTKTVEEEFSSMKAAVERQMSETGTWRDLIMIRSNRNALKAALFLRISQVGAGVYVFAAYTQFIFEKSGGNLSSQTSSIIYMGISFFLYSLGACISDKFGRKKSYTISLFFASCMLFLEGIYFYIDTDHPEINTETIKWFPLAGMIIFIIVSSFGVAIVPTLMMGELFSASIKSKGISVITTLFGIFLFLANYIFYFINTYTGLYGHFFLFGVCCFVSSIATTFLVPETKGKSLEEIQQILKGKKVRLSDNIV